MTKLDSSVATERSLWEATIAATSTFTSELHWTMLPNLLITLVFATSLLVSGPTFPLLIGLGAGSITLSAAAVWVGIKTGNRPSGLSPALISEGIRTGLTLGAAGVFVGFAVSFQGPGVMVGVVGSSLLVLIGPLLLGRVGSIAEPTRSRWWLALAILAISPGRALFLSALALIVIAACAISRGALGLMLPAWWLTVAITVTTDASQLLKARVLETRYAPPRA